MPRTTRGAKVLCAPRVRLLTLANRRGFQHNVGRSFATRGERQYLARVGAVRHVEMPGNTIMEERLESLDDATTTLSYAIVGGPLPVENYLATIKVSANGSGSRVDWGATFDAPAGVPADAIASGVEGAYNGMLAALKTHLGES